MKNELKGHTPVASGPPPPPTYDAPLPPVRHAGETQVIATTATATAATATGPRLLAHIDGWVSKSAQRSPTTKKATVRIAPPPEQAVRLIGKVEIENGWEDKWHPAMSSMTEAQMAEFLSKTGLIPQSRTHRIAPRQNPDAGTNRVLAAWG